MLAGIAYHFVIDLSQSNIVLMAYVVCPASLVILKIVQLQDKVDRLADLSKKRILR